MVASPPAAAVTAISRCELCAAQLLNLLDQNTAPGLRRIQHVEPLISLKIQDFFILALHLLALILAEDLTRRSLTGHSVLRGVVASSHAPLA